MLRSLCLAALLASPAAAGPCPAMTPLSVVLTPPGTVLADGGGIVVAQILQFNGDHDSHGAPATWRFDSGTTPKLVALAPGLDVLVAPATATRLEDAKHGKLLELGHGPASATLDAPAVKAIRRTDSRMGSHSSSSTIAELVGAEPKGVLALVVFDKAGKVARSWGHPSGTAMEPIYASGGCGQQLPGVTDSPVGDEIRLAWVDASGRLSKLSAPVTIVGTGPAGSHP